MDLRFDCVAGGTRIEAHHASPLDVLKREHAGIVKVNCTAAGDAVTGEAPLYDPGLGQVFGPLFWGYDCVNVCGFVWPFHQSGCWYCSWVFSKGLLTEVPSSA